MRAVSEARRRWKGRKLVDRERDEEEDEETCPTGAALPSADLGLLGTGGVGGRSIRKGLRVVRRTGDTYEL
jgi:hypothetical protein